MYPPCDHDDRASVASSDGHGLSFLDLPGEIRNQIYTILLWRRDDMERRIVPVLKPPKKYTPVARQLQAREEKQGARLRPRWGHTILTTPPGRFARTCRQVYREFAPMLYSSHTIVLHAGRGGLGGVQPRCWTYSPSESHDRDSPLEYLRRAVRNNTPADLPRPLQHCASLSITVVTPVNAAVHRAWLDAFDFLAGDAKRLRHLRVTFAHDKDREQCRFRRTNSRSTHDVDVSGGCCIELAKDVALAQRLGRLRRLERLEIRGVYEDVWPAVLDKHIVHYGNGGGRNSDSHDDDGDIGDVPRLAVHLVGFLCTLWDADHGGTDGGSRETKLIRVDYRRERRHQAACKLSRDQTRTL
ncbi:uncharacterized protein B0I36DRAFT_368049 [Microdochium trichocladiopsis]|uniref:Uncharacterized protein n=1 Tax=Microdochium trichocladiopsis TaxID=1682393 RepID=A0A9P8XTU6_9PEZI|nr:uncharacterized protein B0I36DRAFT_368049 [Microdochium trichocladiopsis]KAH7017993.1 hypothetical protein B0I36DRAFT_368049 [Microdochium trichocladiopsis]